MASTRFTWSISEQIAWQRQTVFVLDTFLGQAAKTGLPVLSWTIGSAGANLVGQSFAQPSSTRRDEIQAWADRLDITLREHSSSGMTRIIGHVKQMKVGHTWATIRLTTEIYDDDQD